MHTRQLIACGLAALSLAVAGCSEEETDKAAEESSTSELESGGEASPAPADPNAGEEAAARSKPKVEIPSGQPPAQLQIEDIEEGSGPEAKSGAQISVNYVGVAYSNGKEFDNSFDRGAAFDFQLGAGMVIPGWDQGLVGMKVGGRRKLTIPAEQAYGQQGSPPDIAPGETLVFVIDLLAAG